MGLALYPGAVRGMTYTVLKAPEYSTIVQSAPNKFETRLAQSQNPIWNWTLVYDYLKKNPADRPSTLTYTDLETLAGFFMGRQGMFDSFLFNDPDDNYIGPGVITQSWQKNYPYQFGDIIIDNGCPAHAQQVIDVPVSGISMSGSSAPTWNTSGGNTTDGSLTWFDLGIVPGTSGWPNFKAQLQLLQDSVSGNWYSPIQRNMGGQFYEDITDAASSITVYENGSPSTTAYAVGWGGLSISSASWNGLYIAWDSAPTGPITIDLNYFFRARFATDSQDFEKFMAVLWTIGGSSSKNGSGQLKLVSARDSSLGISGAAYSITPCKQRSAPAPMIDPPAGATSFVILSPTTVVLSNGSGAAYGKAWGAAGENAFFCVEIIRQALGTGGGSAAFSGYALPPNISPGMVKGIFSYSPYFHLAGNANSYARCDLIITGTGVPPGIYHLPYGSYAFSNESNNNVVSDIGGYWVAHGAGTPTLANFPYSAFKQTYYCYASLNDTYLDPMGGNPMVVVYY